VVNVLWSVGVEVMMLMDQWVILISVVCCVGNVFIL